MRDAETKSRRFAKELRQNMTEAEVILWSKLRRGQYAGVRFRRQHPIGPFIVDFACAPARIVIEIDGATHNTQAERAYDKRRTRYLQEQGRRELRFENNEIYDNLAGVLDRTAEHVPPPPSPLRGSAPPPRRAGEEKSVLK